LKIKGHRNLRRTKILKILDIILFCLHSLSNIVTLFFQPAVGNQYGIISLGFLSLSGYLRKNGIDSKIVVLVDKDMEDTVEKKICQFRPKIVCISFHWYIHAYEIIKIAEAVKKTDPNIKVVIGGHSSTYFDKQILDFTSSIDVIIKGDGEKPLLEYIISQNPQKVENISFKKNGEFVSKPVTYRQVTLENLTGANENMNEMIDEWDKYIKTKRVRTSAPISSSTIVEEVETRPSEFYLYVGKGCGFNCCFCGSSKTGNSRIFNRGVSVYRPIEDVVKDAALLKNNGVESLFIDFGPFNDESYFLKLFDRLSKLDLGVVYLPWNLPSNDIISKLSTSFSDFEIQISPDSGSERLRKDLCHRGFHREFYSNALLKKSIDKIAEVGSSRGSQLFLWFMCGLPFESEEDYLETLNLSVLMKKNYHQLFNSTQDQLNCVPLRLTPGSPIDLWPDKFDMRKLRSSFKDYYGYCKDLISGKIEHPLGLERNDLSEAEVIKRAVHYKENILSA